jgi:hypothetical protein
VWNRRYVAKVQITVAKIVDVERRGGYYSKAGVLRDMFQNHLMQLLALLLWNHNDPILKERLFGLAGSEGNHGEDVKEVYFYLDATPTHSYLKMNTSTVITAPGWVLAIRPAGRGLWPNLSSSRGQFFYSNWTDHAGTNSSTSCDA